MLMQSTWLFLAYGSALYWLLIRPALVKKPDSLRVAWRWYATAMLCHACFAVFRAANADSVADLAIVEIWSQGMSWACLGICTLFLPTALLGASQHRDV